MIVIIAILCITIVIMALIMFVGLSVVYTMAKAIKYYSSQQKTYMQSYTNNENSKLYKYLTRSVL